jgi:hypothetical protein
MNALTQRWNEPLLSRRFFPHSITTNAPGLHRNSKNRSTMIGEPESRARSMFAVQSSTAGERRVRWIGKSQKT